MGDKLFWLVPYIPPFFFFKLDQQQLLCSLSRIFPFEIHWPFCPPGLVLGPPLHTNVWAHLTLGFMTTTCSQVSLLHQQPMFLFFFSKEPHIYLTFLLGCPKDTLNQDIQNLLIISPPKPLTPCQCWFQPIQPSMSKSHIIFDLLPPLSISMSYLSHQEPSILPHECLLSPPSP